MLILTEEVGETSREAIEQHWRPGADFERLRSKHAQVAAVAMIEHVDALAEAGGGAWSELRGGCNTRISVRLLSLLSPCLPNQSTIMTAALKRLLDDPPKG